MGFQVWGKTWKSRCETHFLQPVLFGGNSQTELVNPIHNNGVKRALSVARRKDESKADTRIW